MTWQAHQSQRTGVAFKFQDSLEWNYMASYIAFSKKSRETQSMAKGCQGSLLYLPGKLTMQSFTSGFTFPGKAIRLHWSLAMLPGAFRSFRVPASYPSTCIVTNMKKASKARYQAKPIIGTQKYSASGRLTECQMLRTAAHRRKTTSRSASPPQFFRISLNWDASSAAAQNAHACSNPVARIRNGTAANRNCRPDPRQPIPVPARQASRTKNHITRPQKRR